MLNLVMNGMWQGIWLLENKEAQLEMTMEDVSSNPK